MLKKFSKSLRSSDLNQEIIVQHWIDFIEDESNFNLIATDSFKTIIQKEVETSVKKLEDQSRIFALLKVLSVILVILMILCFSKTSSQYPQPDSPKLYYGNPT